MMRIWLVILPSVMTIMESTASASWNIKEGLKVWWVLSRIAVLTLMLRQLYKMRAMSLYVNQLWNMWLLESEVLHEAKCSSRWAPLKTPLCMKIQRVASTLIRRVNRKWLQEQVRFNKERNWIWYPAVISALWRIWDSLIGRIWRRERWIIVSRWIILHRFQ